MDDTTNTGCTGTFESQPPNTCRRLQSQNASLNMISQQAESKYTIRTTTGADR